METIAFKDIKHDKIGHNRYKVYIYGFVFIENEINPKKAKYSAHRKYLKKLIQRKI